MAEGFPVHLSGAGQQSAAPRSRESPIAATAATTTTAAPDLWSFVDDSAFHSPAPPPPSGGGANRRRDEFALSPGASNGGGSSGGGNGAAGLLFGGVTTASFGGASGRTPTSAGGASSAVVSPSSMVTPTGSRGDVAPYGGSSVGGGGGVGGGSAGALPMLVSRAGSTSLDFGSPRGSRSVSPEPGALRTTTPTDAGGPDAMLLLSPPPPPLPLAPLPMGAAARQRRFLVWAFVVAVFFLVSFGVPWLDLLKSFLNIAPSLGSLGYLVFYLAFVGISFPFTVGYTPLVVATGYLYGWFGFVLVSAGSVTGACAVFLLSRRLATTPWAADSLASLRSGRVGVLLLALVDSGLRGALLARLIPVPIGICNAVLSLTALPFSVFFLSTLFGLMPFQLTFVYFGSALHSLEDMFRGETQLGPAQTAVLIVQILVMVGSGVYFYHVARKRSAMEMARSEAELHVV